MNIWKHLEHDHAELASLAERILKSSDGADVGGRDNQFELYDVQVRRHLALVEEVLHPAVKHEERTRALAAEIVPAHKEIRKSLRALDRSDKGSYEWTAEFRDFIDLLEAIAAQHEMLAKQAKTVLDDTEANALGEQYERAKIRRMEGSRFEWSKVGMGVAGAAALAGAAYAANRYFSSARRAAAAQGEQEDDFEFRLETDENMRLISSEKVEGTPVVGRSGQSLGRIENFMVDKYTGRVAYAVMSFGGLGGFGRNVFPLPWPLLSYDEEKGGYLLDITREELANAPRFEVNDRPDFTPEYRRRILLFYTPANVSASASRSSFRPSETPLPTGPNSRSTTPSAASPMATPEPTSVG